MEQIKTKIVIWNIEKKAFEVEEIKFKNGHVVKYVEDFKKNYSPGEEVYVYLWKDVMPKLIKQNNNSVIAEVTKSEDYPNLNTNGISKEHKKLFVISNETFPNISHNESSKDLSIEIVRSVIFGTSWLYARPKYTGDVLTSTLKKKPMFGGNLIYSTDPAFPCKYPIPLFDNYVESLI